MDVLKAKIIVIILFSGFIGSLFGQIETNSFYSEESVNEFGDFKKLQTKDYNELSRSFPIREAIGSSDNNKKSDKFEFALFKSADEPINKKNLMAGLIFLDRQRFRELGLTTVAGEPQLVFSRDFNILISDRMAKILFEDENPIDKVLIWNSKYSVMIKGVFKFKKGEFPFEFDFIGGPPTMDKIQVNKK